uniref:Small ribosomal subunit protein uS15 N-terminal domain-containing protein n=1 Tax=Trichobilharzia regenti TaxID=157069 RepID=A0AA85IW27_TRIRE|nr:unnamed protein product [Trichobilharzia regenti]
MGRMHSGGKGISRSALPYRRSVPSWQKMTADEVKEQVFKLAKKGLSPSQIVLELLRAKAWHQLFRKIYINSSKKLLQFAST